MRDLPLIVARAAGAVEGLLYDKQPFEETIARAAARLGPLQDRDFKPGTYVTYKRRDDYWAKDLPVNRGRFNFDEIRFDYYPRPHRRLEALQGRATSTSARSSRRAIGRPATTFRPCAKAG